MKKLRKFILNFIAFCGGYKYMKETVASASPYSEYEPFNKVLEEKPGVCYGKNKFSLSILFTIISYSFSFISYSLATLISNSL